MHVKGYFLLDAQEQNKEEREGKIDEYISTNTRLAGRSEAL